MEMAGVSLFGRMRGTVLNQYLLGYLGGIFCCGGVYIFEYDNFTLFFVRAYYPIYVLLVGGANVIIFSPSSVVEL